MSVLDVLRDAATELVETARTEDVAEVVRRAVARLGVDPYGADVFVDVFPSASVPSIPTERRGALVIDTGTAGRPDLTQILEVLSSQASLALERIRLSDEIARGRDDKLLVEQASDVILIVDDDNRIGYASPSARLLLGVSELRGLPLIELVDIRERRQAEYLLHYARKADPNGAAGSRADWTIRGHDGRTVRVEVSCRDLRSEQAVRGVVVTLRDVTNQRRLEHELTRRLFRDELTGLPNRAFFYERLSEAIAADIGFTGVLLIDLDDFRAINEALGRETGDAVMQAVAQRLRDAAGDERLTARLGGNEFAVLVADTPDADVIEKLADRLIEALASPIPGIGDMLSCTGSAGVATTMNAETGEELLRHADLALHAAKGAGKGTWRMYDPSAETAAGYRLELRTALSQALRDKALILEYQPIIALDSGRTVGFEALVRWRHPTRGILSPGEFIDIAEESGLITPIGDWVLATAAHDAQEWPRTHQEAEQFVSVNVSARQFRSRNFVETVHRLLSEAGLPPTRLVLEITESLLLRDDEKVWRDLKQLRQWGIRVAIDDFGTGYSALGYLRQVPLDIVKLDRIFISTMATSARQRELVRGIVQLAGTLGLSVVAEGIETERQRKISTDIGCSYGQGYVFARPMSHEDALEWTMRRRDDA